MIIAEGQAGAVCRAQVLGAGGSDRMITQRLKPRLWPRPQSSGVYLVAGVPPSYLQRLWVAHLAAGPASVVSHESAAALFGFTGFPRRQGVLTVAHPGHLQGRAEERRG